MLAIVFYWLTIHALAGGHVAETPSEDATTAEAAPKCNDDSKPDDDGPPSKPFESKGLKTPFSGSRLHLPSSTPAPAIVIFHGSEGGAPNPIAEEDAQYFANQGFVVLSYCYFGCPGKPAQLHDIEMGDAVKAAQWLKQSKHVANNKVGLLGFSRGAEKALLLSSKLKDTKVFSAVAVHAPSDRVVAAFDEKAATQAVVEKENGRYRLGAAWKWKGQRIYGDRLRDDRKLPTGNVFDDIPGPRIPVEDYAGPLFVSHGTADELWEVDRSRRIEKSRKAQKDHPTEMHYFEGECHIFRKEQSQRRWNRLATSFFNRHLGAGK